MKRLDKVLKAVADTNRLRILKLLEKKKMCVCELAFILGITQPSVSKHLKKLESAGLIAHERDGLWINYHLVGNNQYAGVLLNSLRSWLNDDEIVLSDLKRALKADRRTLCIKK